MRKRSSKLSWEGEGDQPPRKSLVEDQGRGVPVPLPPLEKKKIQGTGCLWSERAFTEFVKQRSRGKGVTGDDGSLLGLRVKT